MARSLDNLPARAALVEIARDFHTRGWMAGTAGNLSAREDDHHFWITASGKPKGRLEDTDFLLVRIQDGEVVERVRPDNQPSAESAIHCAIYALFPKTRACLHGHLVEAVIAADRLKKNAKGLRLPAIEMIKGFDIWQQNPKVDLPLFNNHLDVAKIAKEIEARFNKSKPAVTALMIRAHGPTVWGGGLQEAYNRFEVLEFLLRYQAHRR
ncbi:MAG: methylthioribulose 1-phosphate dehydratase [Gammaproteobacteria bacterium]|nr:methylthioribulose 1-phosphate dehydratase [Gammaproteobacteria bacterium]MDH3407114.1 methylthioribulose 1-phosphate dehydratase [Gammaproteobacteria bacterium]